jgi:hypothetical protein
MNTDLFAPDATDVPSPSGWVVCELDDFALAIPRADVLSIEQGSDLAAALHDESAAGWFASPNGPWPAYLLGNSLQPIHEPNGHGFIAFVHAQPAPVGVLCKSVRMIGRSEDLPMQPLPAPMTATVPAVSGVVRLSATRLAYVFAAGAIAPFLSRLTAPVSPERYL